VAETLLTLAAGSSLTMIGALAVAAIKFRMENNRWLLNERRAAYRQYLEASNFMYQYGPGQEALRNCATAVDDIHLVGTHSVWERAQQHFKAAEAVHYASEDESKNALEEERLRIDTIQQGGSSCTSSQILEASK
jgi:hypothetical protein